MIEPSHQTNTNARSASHEEVPLPAWLTRIYYLFPIVLYIPDALFNLYVYSDGSGLDLSHLDITQIPQLVLWGFLAFGIVGMAWLLSVLAPWHWSRGHYGQSLTCWAGVLVATSITTWNSLAYRSQAFKAFITDQWMASLFHVSIVGFSPTMVLVAVSPPFWGLFWAIVQPTDRRRSMEEERESHAMKLERLRQETEVKKLKAEANAQIREAQLKGLASTVRSARAQIAGQNQTPPTVIVDSTAEPPADDDALPGQVRRLDHVRLPDGRTGEEALEEVRQQHQPSPDSASTPAPLVRKRRTAE